MNMNMNMNMNSNSEELIKNEIFQKEIESHLEATKSLIDLKKEIFKLEDKIKETFKNKNKILICGNGGSAADAQHLSSELVGRYEKDRDGFPAFSLSTDVSALTALGNDYGFQSIFSRQVLAVGNKGDLLLVLSTSGNSENIINAVKVANKLGLYTVGLLGRDGGMLNKLTKQNLIIKNDRTCRIQEMHGFIIHIICELFDRNI